MTDVYALPVSFSMSEVISALGVTERQVATLIREGKVGYFKGKRRERRFFPDHITQIREALEVKPTRPADSEDINLLVGMSRTAATRRRNRAARAS